MLSNRPHSEGGGQSNSIPPMRGNDFRHQLFNTNNAEAEIQFVFVLFLAFLSSLRVYQTLGGPERRPHAQIGGPLEATARSPRQI